MLTVKTGDERPDPLVVVMLHGRSMRADDFAPFARSLGVPAIFHFPQGAHALPAGGFGWWPPRGEGHRAQAGFTEAAALAFAGDAAAASRSVASDDGGRPSAFDAADEHPPGRAEARAALATLLRDPQRCPADARVVLAGFSQGGMVAVDTLLHEDLRVHGLALFSSSRVAWDDWRPRLHRLAGLRALVAHGRADDELAFEAGRALHDGLLAGGVRTDWLPFDGGHEVPLVVWRAFRRLLQVVAR